MGRGVARWGGEGFTVVEREEVRKKKENEEKKEGNRRRKTRRSRHGHAVRHGRAVPNCWMCVCFFCCLVAQEARSCQKARVTRANSLDDICRPCLCSTQRAMPRDDTSVPLGTGTSCQFTVHIFFMFMFIFLFFSFQKENKTTKMKENMFTQNT